MSNYSTGLELILNAADGVLQIVLTENENSLCFQEWHTDHATEILAPALQTIFTSCRRDMKGLRRIACVHGPGSFTGIRLVLTTAAAMRRVCKAQLGAINYLQALATTALIWRGLPYGQTVFCMMHARKGLTHFQQFTSFGPQIPAQPVDRIELLPIARALEIVQSQACHVCGSALARIPEVMALSSTNLAGQTETVFMANLQKPSADALKLLARHADYFPEDLEPLYVRECDAVENLREIATKRGDIPEQSAVKLVELLGRKPSSDI